MAENPNMDHQQLQQQGWKASLPRQECKSRLEEVLLLTSSARAAPQTALEFEGKIFHMANSAEHYHQMVEKCVKGGAISRGDIFGRDGWSKSKPPLVISAVPEIKPIEPS